VEGNIGSIVFDGATGGGGAVPMLDAERSGNLGRVLLSFMDKTKR